MKASTAWMMLIAAGLIDVAWALSMKLSQGYTRPWWTAASVVALIAFVWLLGRALTALPVGSAYAVWTGIGAAGTVLIGSMLFGESITPLKLGGVGLIVAGILVLRGAPA
ncbi:MULTISPECIES: multidrug efflux SMR transporter [unclassified Lysobacter]|uniref:DMT family transporter n=1 Tax=unclassified Lysobacter TaxID=2635362 RepID=UPI001BE8DCEA|nr:MULTISPECIES: multidrug efflux SMR transporter [unclassified Lysobacter]MBT2746059.1 multidrug efflux SMR transporter [Lysobacter sp. ISL-42]MBT2752494.1 multidrug efflux SMR transporter [Lysobacter sp. ISL-50]MBT2776777.1 multidrug efflux SMR transporter [Lysobacter sp. ISL-54]MBT2780655.1 multidrug efflux SMR transporter [Lysobacter sp. ISL-52]